MKNKFKDNYIYSLDGIRAIAMLGVMLFHLAPTKVKGGYLGVVTFFVLAGFLSTRNIIYSRKKPNFTNAMARFVKKIRKLLPELITMIVITLAVMFFVLSEYLPPIKSQAISSVFGVNNIVQIINGSSYFEAMATLKPFTHIWALSMEFQFYLLLAISLGTFYKPHAKKQWTYSLVFFAMVSIALMNVLYNPNTDNTLLYYGTFTRMSSFLIGVIGALQFAPESNIKKKGGALSSILITLSLLITIACFAKADISEHIYRYGFLLYALLSIGTIYLATTKQCFASRFLSIHVFGAIARRSYSIYIWHFPVFKLYEKLMWRSQLSPNISLLLEFTLSVIVAEIAYTIFNKFPLKKGLRRYKTYAMGTLVLLLMFFPYKPHGTGVQKYEMLNELQAGISGSDVEISGNGSLPYKADGVETGIGLYQQQAKKNNKEINPASTTVPTLATSDESDKDGEGDNQDTKKTEEQTSSSSTDSTDETIESTEDTTESDTEATIDESDSSEESTENTPTNENDEETTERSSLEYTNEDNTLLSMNSEEDDKTPSTDAERMTTQSTTESTTETTTETTKETTEEIPQYSETELAFKPIYDEYSAMFPNINISFDEYLSIRNRKITLIGDSISAMMAGQLTEFFPNIEISAKKNRQSYHANECYLKMKEEGRIGEVVILALGVNGCVSHENFDLVKNDIGNTPLIITSVIHYNPTIESDLNTQVYNYANNRDNVFVIQWNENCKSKPELLYDDGVHPKDTGARAYSYLIMDAVYRAIGN